MAPSGTMKVSPQEEGSRSVPAQGPLGPVSEVHNVFSSRGLTMYHDHTHLSLPPSDSPPPVICIPLSQLHVPFFKNNILLIYFNPLSPVPAAYMPTGMVSSTGAWEAYW